MLVRLGGGVRDLLVRLVQTPAGTSIVAHLVVDVRDAVGANAVNSMAEAVAERVEEITGGRVLLRIPTNKADLRLARARAVFDAETLGGAEVIDDIVHAYALAAADPYRAATHNKGIMNGITAVVLATGNDTRAVEASAHSHAINADGRYTSMSPSSATRAAISWPAWSCRCRWGLSAAPPRSTQRRRPRSSSWRSPRHSSSPKSSSPPA